jgi:hypothetical protein
VDWTAGGKRGVLGVSIIIIDLDVLVRREEWDDRTGSRRRVRGVVGFIQGFGSGAWTTGVEGLLLGVDGVARRKVEVGVGKGREGRCVWIARSWESECGCGVDILRRYVS